MIVKILVGTFNKEKALVLVVVFSGHCEDLRMFVDSSRTLPALTRVEQHAPGEPDGAGEVEGLLLLHLARLRVVPAGDQGVHGD